MYFRRLLNPWLPALKAGEKKLINSLVEKLPTKTTALIQDQIERINLVQRNPENNEVCFYVIRGWKPYWDPTRSIPTSEAETKFGRVDFKLSNIETNHSADMWLVNGHLFSMELSCSPKLIADENGIEVLSAKVFLDSSD